MSTKHDQTIAVMCVDDHPIFRQGLAAILESDTKFKLVAQAANGEDALAQYRRYLPDVTLMDLHLPGMSGAQAIKEIRAEFSNARIIVLTTETGDAQIQRALKAGAKGYVLKGMPMGDLLQVIEHVHDGQTAIPGLVATQIAEHIGDRPLTGREIEVLELIAQGQRNKSVAVSLKISEETVKMHMKNAMAKLGAKDRTHAVTIAIQRGFFTV